MSQSPARGRDKSGPYYKLAPEIKIRRESFGGILYKYGCADRGALSFINSPQLIELLITSQQQYDGDLNAAIESHMYSAARKQKLYSALDDLARRGYVQILQGMQGAQPLAGGAGERCLGDSVEGPPETSSFLSPPQEPSYESM